MRLRMRLRETLKDDSATQRLAEATLMRFATDDVAGTREVADLLSSMGFRPIYVGPLARARELEAIAFLNVSLQIHAGGEWRTAITLVGAPEAATLPGKSGGAA
jgi:predicted dinucleotide-binding enzyme